MKQQLFELRYGKDWQQLEQLLDKNGKDNPATLELPALYRRLCHQLALAKHRRYSPYLIDNLNDLAMRCHNRLYRNNTRFRYQWLRFLVLDFPHLLRANALYIWISTALFVIPLLAVGLFCFIDEEAIYSIAPAETVRSFENMYDKNAEHIGRTRDSGDNVLMFGYYIKHNISISFQMFAGGMLACIGSIFFLIFNGIQIGGIAGYLSQA
jgi:hypothetical protein